MSERHYKECEYCHYKSEDGKHVYDNDDDRECNICGYDRGHEHFPLAHQDRVEPTCTDDGNIEYFYCEKCDFISKDSIGLVQLDKQDTVLKATGHKAASYEYNESGHWKICENVNADGTCGEKFAEGAHTFSGNKCTACGYIKSSSGGSTGGSGGSKNSDRYKKDTGSSTGSSSGSAGEVSSIIINNSGSTVGWSKDASGRWWFYNGNTKVIGWAYDNAANKWYYVDENKGMLYGWFYDTTDGYWYYLDAGTGEMLTGWQLINGKQYYFAPAPEAATYTFDASSSKWVYSNAANNRPYGSMYANTFTPDNHQVDADGARVQ